MKQITKDRASRVKRRRKKSRTFPPSNFPRGVEGGGKRGTTWMSVTVRVGGVEGGGGRGVIG